MARGQLGPWCTEPDGQAGGQGWPCRQKEMGRKASRAGGQYGARRGRDQSPRRSAPLPEPPSPSMRQLTPVREACFLLTVARPSPSSLPLLPTSSHATCPRQGCVQGVHLCDSLEALAARTQGTAWVRKDLRRLKKWVGDGLALFPHAVSRSRQLAAGDV